MAPPQTSSLAIACTLPAGELPARLRELAALGSDALVDAQIDRGRAALRFRPGHGVRDRVEAVVAAESTCCAFLGFYLEDRDGLIVLTVAAPDDAQVVLEEFVESFTGAAA